MAAGRAKAGGEIGKNGEHYKGGTFLPNTRLPKQGASGRNKATRRVMVEPGVFGDVPAGQVAIYPQIRAFVSKNSVGDLHIMAHLDAPDSVCWQHYGPRDHVQALVEKYNSGQRFIAA
jgi:hypothetical protein